MSDPSSQPSTNAVGPVSDPSAGAVDPSSTTRLPLPPPLSQPIDRTVIAHSPIAGPGDFYSSGTVSALARALIGQTLDHYQIHEWIGGGGMGAVLRGSDTRLDREVAVKVIPNLGRDLETMRRFHIEAQSAAKLDHPHIARVYYVGETEAWSYIVFEYVEGINLRDLVIKQGPLSIDDAVCYTAQVAEALHHASERSVVHRDIKPSNILVTSDGMIKVVDMGLARTTALDRSTTDLTASGVTLGTFDYISPEQARDPRAADVRSDLYSLGCTLYFILTGRPPFPEGTAIQKILMHGSVQAEDPSLFREEIPPDLVAIVRKLMAKQPADRYQSPLDLIADLQILAEIEHLTRSQRWGGTLIGPVTARRSFVETTIPWLLGILLIFGTTWYFHTLHRASGAFDIPAMIESPVESRSLNSASGISPIPNRNIDLPLVGTNDPALRNDSPSLNPLESNTPGESLLASKAAPLIAAENRGGEAEATVSLESGTTASQTVISPTTPAPGPAESSHARILLIRPFQSNDPPSLPYDEKEYQVATGSLQDAMLIVDDHPEIEELWLDDDVWTVDAPIAIRRPSLVIRSAPGRKARVEWRITQDPIGQSNAGTWTDSLRGLVVGSNRLMLDDLELVAFPPSSGLGSIAFADLEPGGAIHLSQSTVTLMPSSGSWTAKGFTATAREELAATAKDSTTAEPIQIHLENVVFRGEGDFFSLPTAIRSEVSWNNGLLAISGRMFEIGGAQSPSRTPPTIRVDLEHVTVVPQGGFARLRWTRDHTFPVRLTRVANQSAFAAPREQPLISLENHDLIGESNGSPAVEEIGKWLDLRGTDNAYDVKIPYLVRLLTTSGQATRIGFDDDLSSSFFTDRASESSIRWSQPFPPAVPVETQSAGDFLQKESRFRPGFLAELLPNH